MTGHGLMDEFTRIEKAAHAGAYGAGRVPPTAAQAQAGNYRVGRARLHGLDLAIEQPRGSVRRGVSPEGKSWANRMAAHYGYISGTRGADGDEIDVFIGPSPESTSVYAINQNDPSTGVFDEHKIMLGFADRASAVEAYRGSYDAGWKGFGSVVSMTLPAFKQWLASGDKTAPIHTHLGLTMDKVFWEGEQPRGLTLDSLLYEMRRHDEGSLVFDAVTTKEIEGNAVAALDALVVPFADFPRQMDLIDAVMSRVPSAVKPIAVQITQPFSVDHTMNVAAVFELSDGQTISIYFRTGSANPAQLRPVDDLVSWKWLLNKLDITAVVAREKGEDFDLRETARRMIRLADRNSRAFVRANAGRAERMATIEALRSQIAERSATLMALQKKLEAARIEREILDSQVPPPAPVEVDAPLDGDWVVAFAEAGASRAQLKQIARQGGYAAILADPAVVEANAPMLDALLGERFAMVRDILVSAGFTGERGAPLMRDGVSVSSADSTVIGSNRDIVQLVYALTNGIKSSELLKTASLVDDMTASAANMADTILMGAAACAPEAPETPVEPAAPVALDGAESVVADARTDDQTAALAASTGESATERADGATVAPQSAEASAVAGAEGEPKAAIEAIVAQGGEPDAIVARLVAEFGLSEADARAQAGLPGVGGIAVTDISTGRAETVARTGDDAPARLDSAGDPPHVEEPGNGENLSDNGPESGEQKLPPATPMPKDESAINEPAPRDPEQTSVNNAVGSNTDIAAAGETKPEPVDGDFKGDSTQETEAQIQGESRDLMQAVDDTSGNASSAAPADVAGDPTGNMTADQPGDGDQLIGAMDASDGQVKPAPAENAAAELAPSAESTEAASAGTEMQPAPGEPSNAPARDRDGDNAFLQSVMDGTTEDVFDPDLPARLEDVFSAYADDADMSAKATAAIRAYTDLMLARATAA
jgi:hypothetical protein